ncbi:unnamed protein product [Closterium sp. NIES-64]|nr:unnamed protein product [Closterium sp. NIES-64]
MALFVIFPRSLFTLCLGNFRRPLSPFQVRDWYVDSFKDISQFPAIENAREEMRFTELLDQVRMRHNNVMPTVAMGVSELKRDMVAGSTRQGLDSMPEIHQFLDRFYMSRIGIRMLIGQHVALHKPSPPPHYIGLICTKVSPVEVARNAVDDARSACMRTYGSAPDVHSYGDPDLRFAYVPAHLHQMLFELVKNSLRAVQEYVPAHLHQMLFELVKNSLRAVQERFADADHDPPPIRLIVADGMEDVTIKARGGFAVPRWKEERGLRCIVTMTPPPIRLIVADGMEDVIKISDEGGGIPRSGLPKIWTYLYTTAHSPIAAANQLHEMPTVMYATPCHPFPPLASPCHLLPPFAKSCHSSPPLATTCHRCLKLFLIPLELITVAPLCAPCIVPIVNMWSRAGYGYGLPISRLYARYFGGDLQVVSMEGYGTDVYLHLNRLRNVQEPLP